jgi:hypothetical protein
MACASESTAPATAPPRIGPIFVRIASSRRPNEAPWKTNARHCLVRLRSNPRQPVGGAELSARDIMEKNFFVSKVSALQADSTMVLINHRGQKRERRNTTIIKLQPNGVDSKFLAVPEKGRWFALHREMINHQTGHRTVIDAGNADPNPAVGDDLFTTRHIERE